MRWRSGTSAYFTLATLLSGSVVLSLVLGWTALGHQFNTYAYDFFFRLEQPGPWKTGSIILAIDEQTLARYSGQYAIRAALADGLNRIGSAAPAAVAVDVILAEQATPEVDRNLENALARTPRLILASYVLPDGHWNDPLERFRKYAVAVGHVHSDFDAYDSVSRDLPLAKAAGHERRWALALDTFLAAKHVSIDRESPDELIAGSGRIPTRDGALHSVRVRYPPMAMGGIPRVSVAELDANPALAARFAGKAVFAGVTAQGAGDRWMTPYSNSVTMPGIEMNANEYETHCPTAMYLVDADPSAGPLRLLAWQSRLAAALIVIRFLGSAARLDIAGAIIVLVASQLIPALEFRRSVVWPWLPGTLAVVFAIATGAAWRHLIVRRELARAEHEKTRYQQAMQFVTHEMRTPLTAIQGSSELISRYGSMPEAKRKQIAELINSESKRLARMIETFLSVERLSAGEMEMKRERFPLAELVERCTERARPFADHKQIEIEVAHLPAGDLTGDRELMEYAVYNLLTNAVKYSPPQTRVRVFGEDERGDRVRLSVEDQGIGMDKKEVGRIFEKFYRTKRAEQSGEAGTGIGLSIVEQIVTQHGGAIHVESEPGKGSRFTLILKTSR